MALIMIFYNEKDGCSLLARVLSGHGHEVCAFEDDRLAVEWLGFHAPDLVILDLDTDFEGIWSGSIFEALKGLGGAPKVIATTGKPSRESLIKTAGLHVDGFLIKPVELDELEELVNRVLERGE